MIDIDLKLLKQLYKLETFAGNGFVYRFKHEFNSLFEHIELNSVEQKNALAFYKDEYRPKIDSMEDWIKLADAIDPDNYSLDYFSISHPSHHQAKILYDYLIDSIFLFEIPSKIIKKHKVISMARKQFFLTRDLFSEEHLQLLQECYFDFTAHNISDILLGIDFKQIDKESLKGFFQFLINNEERLEPTKAIVEIVPKDMIPYFLTTDSKSIKRRIEKRLLEEG